MKQLIFILSILISMTNCQSKSDCFGSRIILKNIKVNVKYENWQNQLFKDINGTKYVACNFPDTLVNNQNYKASIKLLQSKPNEKLLGKPCEIDKIEVQKNQLFEALETSQKILFLGGGGQTKKGQTVTVGIYITRISIEEIEYEFTELLDWKDKREINGRAILQPTTNDKIEMQNQNFDSAFRFVDSKNNIEILITKRFQINNARVRLIEKNSSKTSGLMYYK